MVGAVIVGAGRGERLGAGTPKCFVEIEGIPLLFLSALAFEHCEGIAEIVLVVPESYEANCLAFAKSSGFTKIVRAVAGGDRRQDSVLAGIYGLSPQCDRVLIHDGARPFVTSALISKMVSALDEHDAVFAALPVADTLHVTNGRIHPGPDRNRLLAAQTPQGSRKDLLVAALEWSLDSGIGGTDEITMLYNHSEPVVHAVDGETANIKITRAEDLEFYAPQLKERAADVRGMK